MLKLRQNLNHVWCGSFTHPPGGHEVRQQQQTNGSVPTIFPMAAAAVTYNIKIWPIQNYKASVYYSVMCCCSVTASSSPAAGHDYVGLDQSSKFTTSLVITHRPRRPPAVCYVSRVMAMCHPGRHLLLIIINVLYTSNIRSYHTMMWLQAW